jgi:hypothetical protein
VLGDSSTVMHFKHIRFALVHHIGLDSSSGVSAARSSGASSRRAHDPALVSVDSRFADGLPCALRRDWTLSQPRGSIAPSAVKTLVGRLYSSSWRAFESAKLSGFVHLARQHIISQHVQDTGDLPSASAGNMWHRIEPEGRRRILSIRGDAQDPFSLGPHIGPKAVAQKTSLAGGIGQRAAAVRGLYPLRIGGEAPAYVVACSQEPPRSQPAERHRYTEDSTSSWADAETKSELVNGGSSR